MFLSHLLLSLLLPFHSPYLLQCVGEVNDEEIKKEVMEGKVTQKGDVVNV